MGLHKKSKKFGCKEVMDGAYWIHITLHVSGLLNKPQDMIHSYNNNYVLYSIVHLHGLNVGITNSFLKLT